MGIVNLENITDVVIASLGKHGEITERQRDIMTALIRHLHTTHGEAQNTVRRVVTNTVESACALCVSPGRAPKVAGGAAQRRGRAGGHRPVHTQ